MNTSDQPIIPILLSGGVGSRLWPLSQKAHPKPFLTLPDGDSLLRKTLRRALKVQPQGHMLNVTNRALHFKTKDEVKRALAEPHQAWSGHQHYVLEPCARNTAAAIVTAAFRVKALYSENAVMLVMPSDHLIDDDAPFLRSLNTASDLAKAGHLVTFGIQPTRPEEGFGYIKATHFDTSKYAAIERFIEKPDSVTAKAFVASGEYYWNAGIFCFTPATLLSEMRLHAPALLQDVQHAIDRSDCSHSATGSQLELDPEAFANVAAVSIDYALFEHSQKAYVVPCNMDWTDVGSWQAWGHLLNKDAHGNQLFGKVAVFDTHNTLVHSGQVLTATVGVNDLIVVNTDEAVLVAHKNAESELRDVLTTLTDDTYAK